MTPDELAEIHAACFDLAPRPWSASEIAGILALPNTKLIEHAAGFAVFRIAGPEAELLTIAVLPESRRQGVASNLLERLHESVKSSGVQEVFLEVSDKNPAARALYEAHGFTGTAVRKDYYDGPNGKKINALIMSRSI